MRKPNFPVFKAVSARRSNARQLAGTASQIETRQRAQSLSLTVLTPLTIPERRPTPQEIVASEDGERLTVSSEMFCAVREISRQSPGIKLFNVGFDPGNGGC